MGGDQASWHYYAMVEFILGMSLMFNVAFIAIWVVGIKINKNGQKELEKFFEDKLGMQMAELYKNWMYKA